MSDVSYTTNPFQQDAVSSVTITTKKKGARTTSGDVEAGVVIKQYYNGDISEAIKIVEDWDNRKQNKVDIEEAKSLKRNEPTSFSKVI